MDMLGQRLCEFENHWLLLRPRRVILKLVKGQRVLDVCCGSGDLSAELAAAGCQVVGVDNSAKMVAYARQKRTVARFEQMDATTMPFQHEFDAAVICLALHTLSAPVRAAVGEAMRHAVRAGGRLITLDYAPAPNPNLLGRISYALIERDERSLLSSDPAHYRHFQEFMQNGGLRAWVLARGEAIERQHDYWGGTVELVISRNSAG